MKNKTCGECRWYDYHHLLCVVGGDVAPTDCACDNFIPIKLTNGDKIRQMSDEKLAKVIECPHFEGVCIHRDSEYPCKCCKRDWLKQEAKDE
jgi:hypothetical protein